jgi:hypothetical protein
LLHGVDWRGLLRVDLMQYTQSTILCAAVLKIGIYKAVVAGVSRTDHRIQVMKISSAN